MTTIISINVVPRRAALRRERYERLVVPRTVVGSWEKRFKSCSRASAARVGRYRGASAAVWRKRDGERVQGADFFSEERLASNEHNSFRIEPDPEPGILFPVRARDSATGPRHRPPARRAR